MTPPPCRSCAAPFTLIATVPHDTWECRHEIGCPAGEALGGATRSQLEPFTSDEAEQILRAYSNDPFVRPPDAGLRPAPSPPLLPYSPDPPSRSLNGSDT